MDEIDKLHVRMQGFSQQDVADNCTVARVTIGHILARRQTNYRQETIRKINRALDILGAKRFSIDAAPPITPEQFGAVGDGVTDDTAALKRAVSAASGSTTDEAAS